MSIIKEGLRSVFEGYKITAKKTIELLTPKSVKKRDAEEVIVKIYHDKEKQLALGKITQEELDELADNNLQETLFRLFVLHETIPDDMLDKLTSAQLVDFGLRAAKEMSEHYHINIEEITKPKE